MPPPADIVSVHPGSGSWWLQIIMEGLTIAHLSLPYLFLKVLSAMAFV
jgi:hypothetical protein